MEGHYVATGFRFYPTEEELVSFYLPKKTEGRRQDLDLVIPVLYIYGFNPWDLPQFAGQLCRKDPEQWFFYVPRQEREARGGRPNRLTTSGYWKATGSPGYVYSSDNRVIGEKRTMVFYKGRAPAGRKTEWKMNEYRTIERESSSSTITSTPELSLCRVYIKSKCLRAIDRRPSPAAVITRSAVVRQADHHSIDRDQERASHDRNGPTVERIMIGTTSPDQSSSGDHHANPNSHETLASDDHHDFDMGFEDNEALWDILEQMNWF